MTLRIKLSHLVVGLVVGAILVCGGYALAASRTAVIHACLSLRTRALTVPANGRCGRGMRSLSWNQKGPRGAAGARGATGVNGLPATVSVGTVTTGAAGSQATVRNSGTASNAVLNFGIPQGAAGANAPGTGATAYGQVWMGSALNSASLARGSSNVEVGGGNGTAVIQVSGCSVSGLAEPVVLLSADHDPADAIAGSNTASTAAAYVTGWSPSGAILEIDVSTYDPIHGTTANSDFSFAVYC